MDAAIGQTCIGSPYAEMRERSSGAETFQMPLRPVDGIRPHRSIIASVGFYYVSQRARPCWKVSHRNRCRAFWLGVGIILHQSRDLLSPPMYAISRPLHNRKCSCYRPSA